MKKVPITVDQAWEKMREYYGRCDYETLLTMCLEGIDHSIMQHCELNDLDYETGLATELNCCADADEEEVEYVVVPDGKATEVLYGKK